MGRPLEAGTLELTRALNQHFGFDRFRPHQKEIVKAVLRGQDVFASLPTGGGKSLCSFFILPHCSM
jgi:ATP-dependent DNA helicase RecQ